MQVPQEDRQEPGPDRRPPPSLPVPLTTLIGRQREVKEVTGLLGDRRLVTLTGMGGSGKTRLAVEVAGRHAEDGGEACFVDLTAVTEPARVTQAVADALGVRARGEDCLTQAVTDRIADGGLLLVLDNCEHLVEECARVANLLLRACPALRILATSRETLHVSGELTWPVPPLSAPEPGFGAGFVPEPARVTAAEPTLADLTSYEAVRLFLDRAAAHTRHTFTDTDAPAIAALCADLDGLPLAIELAASRTGVLTVAEIAARLRDRFQVLRSSDRTVRPEHQALWAAVDWSHALLDANERALLRRLSVFSGGFTLPAAEALWSGDRGAVLDLLAALVAKSLVIMEHREDGARYRMLETIRHYAAEKLAAAPAEADGARRRHAQFFLAVAEEAGAGLQGARLGFWLERLTAEHANLRTAMTWFAEQPDSTGELRLASALARYCHVRGHYGEGRQWLSAALARVTGTPTLHGVRALAGAATLAFHESDYSSAAALAEQALALYRDLADDRGVVRTLGLLGVIARERGQYDRSLAYYRDSRSTAEAAGDHWGVLHALQMSGITALLTGDLDGAAALLQESLTMAEELEDPLRVASSLTALGAVAHQRNQTDGARRLLNQAITLHRSVGFKEGEARSLSVLGRVELRAGRLDRAAELLTSSLRMHHELGDRWQFPSVVAALAAVWCAVGEEERAAVLMGAATGLREAIGAPVSPYELAEVNETLELLRKRLPKPAMAEALAHGRALTMDQVHAVSVAGPSLLE